MKEENIVMPDYKHCILGTITSILKYYNVDSKHKSSEKIDKILNEKNYKIFSIYPQVNGKKSNFSVPVCTNPYFSYQLRNTIFSSTIPMFIVGAFF